VVMLSDKDRVNRTALIALALARVGTRAVVSTGTTVSIDLASRGPLDRWLQRRSMRHLYPRAYRVIVTSRGVADDMAAYTGLARDHIDVVPSPVITDAVLARAQAPLEHPWFQPGEPPVILGVGELCERKDFATLIRAFARVRAERTCRLVIFGKGNQHEQLLALGRELGIADDLDLPGFEANPYRYMAAASVFVLSSLWEGLGFVTIEALAVGTPVVCVDCPSGPREILADGRYGPLVPVGDAGAMAEAIAATLDSPLPGDVLKQAAAPYAVEHATTAYLEAMGLAPTYDDTPPRT
jgi:glycosyltransferase involved in cell wall biosynthesis